MEEDEISDPVDCGAEVSFVSNGSTLVSTQKCGFQGCTNISTNSRDYKMTKGMREEKAWCKKHKWCSKHHKYELAGKCTYSIQIGRKNAQKNNAKVRFPFYSRNHKVLLMELTATIQVVLNGLVVRLTRKTASPFATKIVAMLITIKKTIRNLLSLVKKERKSA
jgi:hypothetical protein